MAKVKVTDLFRAYLNAKKESIRIMSPDKVIASCAVKTLSKILKSCNLEVNVPSDLLISSAIFFPKSNERIRFEKITEVVESLKKGQLLHIYFFEKSGVTNLKVKNIIKGGRRKKEVVKIIFEGECVLFSKSKPQKEWLFEIKGELSSALSIKLSNIEVASLKLSSHSPKKKK